MKRNVFGALLALGCLSAVAQSVPPTRAEREAANRKADVAGAVSTAMEVKSGLHHVPAIADAYTGRHYEKALGTYGSAVGAIGAGAQLSEGWYRDGWTGLVRAGADVAVDYGVDSLATSAAAAYGHPAAPIVAAGAAGVFAGRQIDKYYGKEIFNATGGKAWDAGYGVYDRHVLEPQREAMGQALREKHQRAKAEHAAQAAAQYQAAPYTPASGPPPGPSAVEQFVSTLAQIQQAQLASKTPPAAPAADAGPGNGMHNPDSFCPVVHRPGVCPPGAAAGSAPPVTLPRRP